MALANMGFNEKFGLILEDQKNRREKEGEKKRKRKRRREEKFKPRSSKKVWKLL